jgi:trypsin
MKVRVLCTAVLTLAVLLGGAPVAGADDGLRPVARPTAKMVEELLDPPAAVQADVPVQADVFNGRFVARGQFPYAGLVVLIDPKTGVVQGECSGSLIRPRFVLTAGHCTKRAKGAVFIPKVVDLRKAKPRDVYVASAVATAPRYSARSLRDDVGLLKLSRAANVTPVQVADAVDDQRYGGGSRATVVGWGAVDRRLKLPMRVRRGSIALLGNERCEARWGQVFKPNSMICGGSRVTDTCVGDSGGPLLVRDRSGKWLLLGATSFGRQPCGPALDSVYARASSVRPWIERVTGLAPRRS